MAKQGRGAAKPRYLVVVDRVGKKFVQPELGAGGGVEGGDEFAADSVARVGAGFVEGHWHACAAQGKTEGEAGEAAADDFDGARGFHARRRATRR